MLRAVALAARLDFTIDEPVLSAIERYHGELARSAPPRLMEEIYKVLRAGAAENTFRRLVDTGLLAAHRAGSAGPHHTRHSGSRSRPSITIGERSSATPRSLANAMLLGSLLIPLGLLDQHHGRTKELGARFGMLPLARRDVEFLRQILMLQRHLRDLNASPRHKRGIMHRTAFPAALMWLELHGNAPRSSNPGARCRRKCPRRTPKASRTRLPRSTCRDAAGVAADADGIHMAVDTIRRLSSRNSLVDFVDRLVGMREPQRDQKPDDRP